MVALLAEALLAEAAKSKAAEPPARRQLHATSAASAAASAKSLDAFANAESILADNGPVFPSKPRSLCDESAFKCRLATAECRLAAARCRGGAAVAQAAEDRATAGRGSLAVADASWLRSRPRGWCRFPPTRGPHRPHRDGVHTPSRVCTKPEPPSQNREFTTACSKPSQQAGEVSPEVVS
jgi:hypothetical protein